MASGFNSQSYIDEKKQANTDELYGNGTYSGEVVLDYEEISTAKSEEIPSELIANQEIDVIISDVSEEYVHREDIISVENNVSRLNYIEDVLDVYKKSSIYSDVFNVYDAIPSNELVKAKGEFSKYAYKLKYQKIEGKRTYGIKVNVRYLLHWIDVNGKEMQEVVIYSRWYYVERPYRYYKNNDFELYKLSGWNFGNTIIGNHTLSYNNDVQVLQNNKAIVMDAKYPSQVDIDGGIVYGNNHDRPAIPIEDHSKLVNSYVGEIKTESDTISINGEEIIGNLGVKLPKENEVVTLHKENMEIKKLVRNGSYVSTSRCIYSKYNEDIKKQNINVSMNNIIVHTPVVCTSWIEYLEPEKKVVQGTGFTVGVENIGQHKDVKSYGWKDYSKYVDYNQVRFPFNVYRNEALITKNTWIEVTRLREENIFYIAEEVILENYKIEFRTLAINYDKNRMDYNEEYFNEMIISHSAYSYQNLITKEKEITAESNIKNYIIVGTH